MYTKANPRKLPALAAVSRKAPPLKPPPPIDHVIEAIEKKMVAKGYDWLEAAATLDIPQEEWDAVQYQVDNGGPAAMKFYRARLKIYAQKIETLHTLANKGHVDALRLWFHHLGRRIDAAWDPRTTMIDPNKIAEERVRKPVAYIPDNGRDTVEDGVIVEEGRDSGVA